MSVLFSFTFSAIAACLVYGIFRTHCTKEGPPLPPGPQRLPIIGNLLDLPAGFEAAYWAKHRTLYGLSRPFFAYVCYMEVTVGHTGQISSVSVFGNNLIIVNDMNMAFDLLEKRSSNYSSRPRLIFAGEMYVSCAVWPALRLSCFRRVGGSRFMPLQPYGERLRTGRKMLHSYLGTESALKKLVPVVELEAYRLAHKLLESPEHRTGHLRA